MIAVKEVTVNGIKFLCADLFRCQVSRETAPGSFMLVHTTAYATLREAKDNNPGLWVEVIVDCPHCGEGSMPCFADDPMSPVIPCFECSRTLRFCQFYELKCETCPWRVQCLVVE